MLSSTAEDEEIEVRISSNCPADSLSHLCNFERYCSLLSHLLLCSLAFGDDADMEFLKKLSLRNSGFARKIYEASDAALQLNQFYKQVSSPLLSNVTFKYQENQVVSDSLTRTNFHTLFDGSELIISGRLHATEITGEVNARGCTGLICPRIVKPEIIPGHKRNFMERMWAFLTIQQLLDKITAEEDNASLKQKALELALKYSFVTSLTSLVVVKPDDTTAEAETKRADIAEDLMYQSSAVMMCAPSYPEKTDGEGDIDDDQATDWSSSDEDNENIDDKDENHRND
uniref:(California timema) hypothetical protein n=1 Tax=Timema californicum TaxID=61474 RepID=A0A7R9J590_TIMCA|nr:unnamed protein product [Timema californicum]